MPKSKHYKMQTQNFTKKKKAHHALEQQQLEHTVTVLRGQIFDILMCARLQCCHPTAVAGHFPQLYCCHTTSCHVLRTRGGKYLLNKETERNFVTFSEEFCTFFLLFGMKFLPL